MFWVGVIPPPVRVGNDQRCGCISRICLHRRLALWVMMPLTLAGTGAGCTPISDSASVPDRVQWHCALRMKIKCILKQQSSGRGVFPFSALALFKKSLHCVCHALRIVCQWELVMNYSWQFALMQSKHRTLSPGSNDYAMTAHLAGLYLWNPLRLICLPFGNVQIYVNI